MYSFCNSTLTSIRGNCNSTGPGPRAVGAAGLCRGEGGGAGLAVRGAHGTCRAQRAATAGRCAGGGGETLGNWGSYQPKWRFDHV